MEWLSDHFERLNALLRRRGRSREESEDCIQDAYVKVIQYLEAGGEVREPEAFLVTTVLNVARDSRAKEHRELYSSHPLEHFGLVDVSANPDDQVAADQCVERLSRVWEGLGPRTQETYYLHRMQDLSYLQIAQTLGISVSAVEKNIARAVAALSKEARRE